jgi:hypothetical protein
VVKKQSQTYPIAIVEDRYTGAYSNGTWLAIAQAELPYRGQSRINFVLSKGPHGDDSESAEFWAAPPDWIAVGDSPQEALDRLLQGFKEARGLLG